MTPRERLVVHEGPIDGEQAEGVMRRHKIKKLPLVDAAGGLIGLVTAKDLVTLKHLALATRDRHGRLRVGAAIGAKGDSSSAPPSSSAPAPTSSSSTSRTPTRS
jgi:IMP dehydrogenase